MADTQINQDIRENLLKISRLIREAGDTEICYLLDRIIRLPDQIAALHAALGKKLSRRKRETDTALAKRRSWFQNFETSRGERLTPAGVNALAHITKGWALSTTQINALLACSTLWVSIPALFWHGGPPDKDVLRNCYNDLARMHEVDPLRRRLLLVTLSDQVQKFQRTLSGESKTRRRPQKANINSKRERIFLPGALRSLTMQRWPEASPENQAKIRTRIKEYSRAGWKWQQLAPIGMLLSFQDSTVKGFERHPWTLVEIKAVNAFIKTLPQFHIHSHLKAAFDSITASYGGDSTSRQSCDSVGHDNDITLPTGDQPIRADAAPMFQGAQLTPRSTANIVNPTSSPSLILENNAVALEASATTPSDTQAATILTNIPRDLQARQNHNPAPERENTREPSPTGPQDPRACDQESNPTSPQDEKTERQAVAAPQALHDSIQGNGVPRAVDSGTLVSQQEDPVFELAEPLAAWRPASYELDWGAALPENSLGLFGEDNIIGAASNPFPPCDPFTALASLEWVSLASEQGLRFGEDVAMIDSVSS